VILEGRDAAGKDGTIKRIVQHLSPREVRVVALGKPTASEQGAWYFSRWVAELPIAGEFVLFNRSWYNRAGVERVMGYATPAEVDAFLEHAPTFERMLADGGIELLKYYLDISREEQARRLEERASDPLTQWKSSPIDGVALEKFEEYSAARDEMLLRTHSEHAPWTVVKADSKRPTRLAVIRDVLSRVDFPGKRHELLENDPDRIRPFAPSMIGARWLAY
jgi:polyphosphate kinase 2